MEKIQMVVEKLLIYPALRGADDTHKGSIAAVVLAKPVQGITAINLSVRELNRKMDEAGFKVDNFDVLNRQNAQAYREMVGVNESIAALEIEERIDGSDYMTESGETRKYGYDYSDPEKPTKKDGYEEGKSRFVAKVSAITLSKDARSRILDAAMNTRKSSWSTIDQLLTDNILEQFSEETK